MRTCQTILCIVPLVVLVTGCATAPGPAVSSAAPVPRVIEPPPASEGAIYRAGQGVALFEDLRARHVGDTVTVVLSEQTNASKTASTSTSKDNSIDVDNPTLFGSPLAFRSGALSSGALNLDSSLTSAKSFTGEGESEQSNELRGSITARVIEVLPNGHLRIQGDKVISINQGDEYIRLTGVVRPVDIQADNTVASTLVADAKISYGGSGVVASANDMGWLGKVFNSRWWPF